MVLVLESTKKVLHLVGLGKVSLIRIGKKSITNVCVYIVVVISQVFMALPFALYAIDDKQLLTRVNNPAYAIISITSMTLIYIDLVLHKKMINQTIDFLTKITTKRAEVGGRDSKFFFDEAEQQNNILIDRISKFTQCLCVAVLFPFLLGPTLYFAIGKPDPLDWFQQYQIKVPFKSFSHTGLVIFCLFQSLSAMIYMILFAMILSLYIGLFRYTCELFDAFERDLLNINRMNIDTVSSRLQRHKTKSDPNLRFRLISMIKFHLDIFHLMDCIQKTLSGPFFKQLCTYAIFIVHSLNSPDITKYTFDVINGIYCLLIHTMVNFVICYFADAVTFTSLNIANVLYSLNWFEFRDQEQKLILLMIKRSQVPFYFKGNNSIVCSLHTFLRTLKSVFFYYTFFKFVKQIR